VPAELRSPLEAQKRGVGVIFQDFKLVPELTVAENILLGNEPRSRFAPFLDRRRMLSEARQALNRLGKSIDPSAPVSALGIGDRQMVEIAKAITRDVRILAMDEPTASLTETEIAGLFGVIRHLRAGGTGVIYISHRLNEIFEIGDRITVLRDGRAVHTCPVAGLDRAMLIRYMVGREIEEEYPKAELERGPVLLRVEGLSAPGVEGASFELCRGEILGFAGLVGAGRTQLALALFGASARTSGRVLLEGREVFPRSPHEAIREGIGLLTEDRNRYGLVLQMRVRENISLANLDEIAGGLFLSTGREKALARHYVDELQIRPAAVEAPVETLSGGNRQKVVIARWLNTKARLLIFDEPTAGIDVGARHEIYLMINRLAASGVGIMLISSDLPELLGVCDRIAVMNRGRIAGVLSRGEATQERVMTLATASEPVPA